MKKLVLISLILALGVSANADAAAKKRATPASSAVGNATAGQAVFDKWCAACHASGPNHPGTIALQAKYDGSLPAALSDRTDLTPEIIHYFIRNGISIMPPFRKTEITDKEEQDLIAYLRRNNDRNPHR